MILSHNIKNLDNVTESMALEEMLSSDVIVTKRGHLRDSITYLGLNNFTDKFILDIDDNIEENINSRLNDVNSAKISIDISLMERKSLAELFSIIAKLALNNNITIVIIYSLAKYSPPCDKSQPNNKVKPVSNFFSGWSSRPGLSVLSVVGLGYEKDKAVGAIEYLESSNAFLYVPYSVEEKYFDDVLKENSKLLDHFGVNNRFVYQLESPTETIYSLDAVISANKNKYKVVLLPFGPKLFYALSLVSCIPHPEVSVWYVSGEEEDGDSSQDREVSRLIGFKFDIIGA